MNYLGKNWNYSTKQIFGVTIFFKTNKFIRGDILEIAGLGSFALHILKMPAE